MSPSARHLFSPVIAAITAALLTGCGTTTGPDSSLYNPIETVQFERVASVKITLNDTRAAVESRYLATVISWHPEDGYAMLAYNTASGVNLAGAQPNQKAYKAPVADDSKAFGLSAWSSGWSAWSGGWSAWSGGWSAWSGGNGSSMPGQNAKIWSKIKLDRATSLAPNAGQDVVVAVIDTGLDLQHPLFQGALTPANTWWDWVSGDANPQEETGGSGFGHGTCVAGIVLQVAPKAKIMPLRVLGPDGMGDTANVIAAIDWAVAKGAKVINLSLGTTKDKSLEQVIDSASKAGVLVVASSGNTGDQNVTYPASDSLRSGRWGENAIGVGSSSLNDMKSSFSTYGQKTNEMTAIGEGVSSAAPGALLAVWNGTSMAAPMVSGGLALALGQRSFAAPSKVGKEIAVTSDSLSLTDKTYGNQLGGRLNLERFLQSVLNPSFK